MDFSMLLQKLTLINLIIYGAPAVTVAFAAAYLWKYSPVAVLKRPDPVRDDAPNRHYR